MRIFPCLVASALAAVVAAHARAVEFPDALSVKAARVLFETGFERFEGYDTARDLVDVSGRGQNGWTAVGYGGNGILADPLPGFAGQYAYIGFQPSTNASGFFNVFRPLRFIPGTNAAPVVVFNVTFSVRDERPSPAVADDFRWSVYTPDDRRLFTLDLHGPDRTINYALDDAEGFVATGYEFEYGAVYDLEIVMSLGRNRWSASLNGLTVVYERPVTTLGAPRSLGSIDAVWAANAAGTWDDNYMLFDDYRITAYPPADIAPVLEMSRVGPTGVARLRVWGEPGVRYLVQSSNDLVVWTDRDMVTGAAADGVALWDDTQPAPARYYRAVSRP
jgi:hypothetical protein